MARALVLIALSFVISGAIPTENVRQEVDQYARGLQSDISKSQRNAERFRSLSRVLDEIRMVRENGMPANQTDDGYMDLMVNALESVPREKDFKKQDCARYENDFINQFEPTAEEAPMEPAIRPAWAVLQAICR